MSTDCPNACPEPCADHYLDLGLCARSPNDDVLDRLRVKRICWGCGAKTRRGHDRCAQCARRPREDEGSV